MLEGSGRVHMIQCRNWRKHIPLQSSPLLGQDSSMSDICFHLWQIGCKVCFVQ
jgi:hypothetical protein